jgi:hypothetical protein
MDGPKAECGIHRLPNSPYIRRHLESTMVLYRRSRLAGQSYFFTLGLQDRSTSTLTDHISLLGLAIRAARARRPF